MAIIKFINNKVSLKKTLNYICKEEKTENKLITGINCVTENAYDEMMRVKTKYNKNTGRDKIHLVQSFNPEDNLSYETAHEIGIKLAKQFKGFQVVVATHQDTNHIHNHIVINSVNYENGRKFHQSKADLERIKQISNELCREYGLSISDKKARVDDIRINEYKVRQNSTSWKLQLEKDIDKVMAKTNNKFEFINEMNKLGYKVTWTKERNNITYTTPEGMKCRDRKLHSEKYLKENMESYYKSKQQKKEIKLNRDSHIRYTSMAFSLAQIIENFKKQKYENEEGRKNFTYNKSAQKQYLLDMHYSSEELEDMEM